MKRGELAPKACVEAVAAFCRDMAERLELLFSGQASVETGPSDIGGFRVCLELPLTGVAQGEHG